MTPKAEAPHPQLLQRSTKKVIWERSPSQTFEHVLKPSLILPVIRGNEEPNEFDKLINEGTTTKNTSFEFDEDLFAHVAEIEANETGSNKHGRQC